jgi:glycerate-2-kinase
VGCERIEIVEAAHPVPDDAGLRAAQRIAELVRASAPTISSSASSPAAARRC